MLKTEILTKAKSVFTEMIEKNTDLHPGGSRLELYKTVRDIEKKSQRLYQFE